MIKLQKFKNFEEAESIQSEWDRFVEVQTADIFLTYDWCRIWWKYYGKKREPLLFVFRNEGKICGILPMFRERIRLGPVSARVVKLMCTDFSPVTITIPISREYLEAVVSLLLEELGRSDPWNLLYFGAICGRYPDTGVLVEALRTHLGKQWVVEVQEKDVQTYFQVKESWEKQVETLSPRQRTKTRRVYKELRDRGLKLESDFAKQESVSDRFERFVLMHQAQWNCIGMPGHFAEWPSSREYHREMAETQFDRQRLRLLEIRLDGKCIGYEYIYRTGNTYCWFLSARVGLDEENRIDFHRIAFGEKVEKAVRESVKFIDSMRGRYEYKLVMGGELYPISSVFVFPADFPSKLVVIGFRWMVWAMNLGYYKFWRRRIVPRLAMKPRRFLDLWIRSHMLAR